jgi:hypothetical protein
MGGGDQVDVVAAGRFQLQHHGGQLLCRYRLSPALMADLAVLAEMAQQVAVGEKDGSGAMLTTDGRLLAEMGIERGYHGPGALYGKHRSPPLCGRHRRRAGRACRH